MSGRRNSGFYAAAILGGGLLFFAALIALTPAFLVAAWAWFEVRAYRAGKVSDLEQLRLDGMEVARFEASRNEASDTVGRLVSLEESEGTADPMMLDAERDQLIGHYKNMLAVMGRLRGLPLKRLRVWSAAQAGRFSTRVSMAVALLAGAAGLAATEYLPSLSQSGLWNALSLGTFVWAFTLGPMIFISRRSNLERSFPDIDDFRDSCLPDGEEFLEHYLARRERAAADAGHPPGQPDAEQEPEPAAPFEEPAQPSSDRPKRPWHEVLKVDPGANGKAIGAAWRTQIKLYHPDRLIGFGPELHELAETITREVNAAYDEATNK